MRTCKRSIKATVAAAIGEPELRMQTGYGIECPYRIQNSSKMTALSDTSIEPRFLPSTLTVHQEEIETRHMPTAEGAVRQASNPLRGGGKRRSTRGILRKGIQTRRRNSIKSHNSNGGKVPSPRLVLTKLPSGPFPLIEIASDIPEGLGQKSANIIRPKHRSQFQTSGRISRQEFAASTNERS